MKIEKLYPLPKNKIQFKLSFYKSVPKISGCYVLTTFDDDILYIGLSENLNTRFQQHLESPEKFKPTNNGKAIWFHFIEYDKINLSRLERTWINQFVEIHSQLPILNKINSAI